jgi:hypothetical protein
VARRTFEASTLHSPRRFRLLAISSAILVGSSALALGCSDAGNNAAIDGASDGGMSGLALAHAYDVLVEETHDLRCKVCPCGAFVPATPQGEACTGAVLDTFPDAKARAVCSLGVEEDYKGCLATVADCMAADECEATRNAALGNCPFFDETAAATAPPAACQGI